MFTVPYLKSISQAEEYVKDNLADKLTKQY
jgi:hypothetical protein